MARIRVRLVRETDEGEELRDLWADLFGGASREAQGEGNVVIDGRRGQQVKMLKDHADVAALFAQFALAHRSQIVSVNDHLTACWALEQIDASDERGFAYARESDDAVDRAALDAQIDAAQGMNVVRVCFNDIFEFNHIQPSFGQG